ncbi:glutamate-5-semialdehyde dehydrogenase [Akkermansiaceae bacterium]|nr:glutamate-5-semialdehyde dehydrogenase [Akkermansiaceae bacterium]
MPKVIESLPPSDKLRYVSAGMTAEQIKEDVYAMGKRARSAAHALAILSEEGKNEILRAMAAGIRESSTEILAANALDISAGEERGLTSAMLDRLRLDETRLEAVAAGVEKVATLPDPVGEVLGEWDRPNGIRIQQVRVPIGVIGIIYESRPNVTSDAAVLCLKSGNATILRGGSEAIHSNRAIAEALQSGGEKAGLPEGAIQLIPFTDRESVAVMAGMDKYLDLIIPRGGKGLIETVVSLARMPVIKHYDGICHAYVHSDADQEMAVKIVVDSKTQKPSVCNALETLLVDVAIADEFLPKVAAALGEKNVELRGDDATQAVIPVVPASEEDWNTEYLDYILSVKVVASLDEAIAHINEYSSQHSEVIVTENQEIAERFLRENDSACLFHNVSTRFSDGEEFGFGAEIGISTDKLHARGPMGLRELTSYQYRIRGEGQTKA